MPTLFWRNSKGNTAVTRPNVDGIVIMIDAPYSLASGEKMKLASVDGLSPEVSGRLMMELG